MYPPSSDPFQLVDCLKLLAWMYWKCQTGRGSRYVIAFVDYVTKWVEVYAVCDQTSGTIAALLIDNIVCRHGSPMKLLSDKGANFLSALMMDVCKLIGIKKLNTTVYHPRGNGLVEKFNNIRSMIAKHAQTHGPSWDLYI